MTEVWLLVPLTAVFSVGILVWWFPLASRESNLECPSTLIIAKAAGMSMASNSFEYNRF